MNVLSLFSGIGAFDLGLERAGMRTVAFCESDPYCRRVLAKHWPEVPQYDDVRSLTAERLRAAGISVDVICGGFPCTDISVAGRGAGITGPQSGLWREFARLIGEIRPRHALIENVANLLSGSDEIERPTDRCLCGWPYGWRGLRQHRPEIWARILSSCGYGYERQGFVSAAKSPAHLWRQDTPDPAAVGKVGTSLRMGAVRQAAGTVPAGDPAARDAQDGTDRTSTLIAEDDLWTAEETEWLGCLDRGGEQTGEDGPVADAGVEPQGTDANAAGWLACEACGRPLADAAARPSVASWMGDVLGDLAALGYDAEWHCIPAAAVGASHERDRVWIVAYPETERRTEAFRFQSGAQAFAAGEFAGMGAEDFRQWPAEAVICRGGDVVADRVDRVGSLGNSLIPQIPEMIGRAIMAVAA